MIYLVYLITVPLYIAMFMQPGVQKTLSSLGPTHGLEVPAMIFITWICALLCTTLHELGHLLAARHQGFQVTSIQVFHVLVIHEEEGWRLRWKAPPRGYQGMVTAETTLQMLQGRLAPRYVWLWTAGVVMDVLTLLVATTGFSLTSGVPQVLWGCLAIYSVYSILWNLYPLQTEHMTHDGWFLWNLWKFRTDAEPLMVLYCMQSLLRRVRAEDIPLEPLQKAAHQAKHPQLITRLLWMLHHHQVSHKKIPEAMDTLKTFRTLADPEAWGGVSDWSEAYVQARHLENPQRARELQNSPCPEWWPQLFQALVEVVTLTAENKGDLALERIEKIREEVKAGIHQTYPGTFEELQELETEARDRLSLSSTAF
ncbi:hypothetical protein [Deinococcus cellulosilyticus]|uniref:Peptidase M50 domain-containing protein n=1 Tax=Deinococcus cellulosilyticus (strain DSM 18568 / NBRC 106333 / KACC 11606 / 5516J-15) TaxID=1223518 RepID=A0A511N350_DEIC1|nr:hypothetical protein [Deinococcus cellulosilyticus]GEM46927.1 hypothetical protein DC3_25620 [Deinococcus cellulosilyticus NBRC 106333 = KACC 11606]